MVHVNFKEDLDNNELYFQFMNNEEQVITSSEHFDMVEIECEKDTIELYNHYEFYNYDILQNRSDTHKCVLLTIDEKQYDIYAYSFTMGTIIVFPLRSVKNVQRLASFEPYQKLIFKEMKPLVNEIIIKYTQDTDYEDIEVISADLKSKVITLNHVFKKITPFYIQELVAKYEDKFGEIDPLLEVNFTTPIVELNFGNDDSFEIRFSTRYYAALLEKEQSKEAINKIDAYIEDNSEGHSHTFKVEPEMVKEVEPYLEKEINFEEELALVDVNASVISQITTSRKNSYCKVDVLPVELCFSEWYDMFFYQLTLNFKFGENAHIGDYEDLLKSIFDQFVSIYRTIPVDHTDDTTIEF